MNNKNLFFAICDISESYLSEYENEVGNKNIYASIYKKTITCIACFAFVIVAGLGLLNSGIFAEKTQIAEKKTIIYKKSGTDDENNAIPNGTTTEDINVTNSATVDYFIQWNGKTISNDLKEALDNGNKNNIYCICAKPYIDYNFVYNGKTLNEYYEKMCDERNLPELLLQLLKDGDSLKYGTKLYEGGAENGEKWAKELYEERIKFYGEDILNKYIVNGEFLSDKIVEDIEIAKQSTCAEKLYKTAFLKYKESLVKSLPGSYRADINSDEFGILLYLTEEEFKNFIPTNLEAWTFSLANSDND